MIEQMKEDGGNGGGAKADRCWEEDLIAAHSDVEASGDPKRRTCR